MYKTRKEMLAKPVYKTLLIILVIAVCFVFAYIKDVSAASVNDADYGQIIGKLYGKNWSMSSVVLKRKFINGFETLVLEFNEKVISESDL